MELTPPPATPPVEVLLPTMVERSFTYAAPVPLPAGTLVEVNFSGRKLVGAVWEERGQRPEVRGQGEKDRGILGSSSPLEGEPNPSSDLVGGKTYKLKPLLQSFTALPPLRPSYLAFIERVAAFTLAPKGMVLSLGGLAHATKKTRKAYIAPDYHFTPADLLSAQHAAAQHIIAATQYRAAAPKPILLDGVTGSGKTEVYFAAMGAMLGGSRQSSVVSEERGQRPEVRSQGEKDCTILPNEAGLQRSPHVGEPNPLADWVGGKTVATAQSSLVSNNAPSSLTSDLWPLASSPSPQILVLLPEIALTHQWLERFTKAFGAEPIVWHSQQTPAAKARAWQAIARGEARVVVGARSALFLPFANLGLIVVDEEHDPSYKQEEGVLYHARDMAVLRAHLERIPLVLVSATPSLETLENVAQGKYEAIHLPTRFGSAGMPTVRVVDMKRTPPAKGQFLAPALREAMAATLARGEQVLLFLNRRGYAPLLLCRGCGHRFECPHCSAWLSVHGGGRGQRPEVRGQGEENSEGANATRPSALTSGLWSLTSSTLLCHHCGHRAPMPDHCPSCAAPAEQLASCGPGVERIAEEVEGWLREERGQRPEARGQEAGLLRSPLVGEQEPLTSGLWPLASPPYALLSSDADTPPELWESIIRGEIPVLIGTQMVAKGHHFPHLTMVGVVDADIGLQGSDLRSGERTYQLLHQLAGRAGRGDAAGEVWMQTYQPDHPVLQALCAHDRDAVMAMEREMREIGNWPPFGQLAAILLDGKEESRVKAAGMRLAQSAPLDPRITVLGPAPAPLSKLRGQYRYRLLVKAERGIHLQRTLRAWLAGQSFTGVRVKLDVNPYYFL